jgi:selenoprotein W-related protein
VTIIPSSGGVYEVMVDGELVYSKKATGKHAEHDQVLAEIRSRV